NRKVLAEGKESVERFVQSVLPLEDRLGPPLLQFGPAQKVDRGDLPGFLRCLPEKAGGRTLRHVAEVRHDSFRSPEFLALLRQRNVGLVYAEHFTYPEMADVTADFVYARLQKGSDEIETAYPIGEIDAWAGRLKAWAGGAQPDALPRVERAHKPEATPRDVYAYVIHEGKVRAPAAAKALIERVA